LVIRCKFNYKLTCIMNGNAKILFFCMIFVACGAFGQNSTKKLLVINDLYKMKYAAGKSGKSVVSNYGFKKDGLPSIKLTINNFPLVIPPVSYSLISPAYYTQNFGFFCKKELQVEKLTKIPFRFRLGSMQQCDWLEGKPNAVK
jgi:hypothetical protein